MRSAIRRLRVGGKQNTHRHKRQPKTGLQQSPGIKSNNHRHGQQPDVRPGPLASALTQSHHHRQHPHRALRRQAPARKSGIRHGQRQATPGRYAAGGAGQTQRRRQTGRAAPQRTQQPRSQPGKQRDVQAGNADQVRDARGPENIPVTALNGGLVTHHQRGQHTGQLAVGDAFKNCFAHALSSPLYAVPKTCPGRRGQLLRRRVAQAGAHIAGGLHALLPQAQLIVKAMRVAVAVRRFEPDSHLPPLASAHGLRQALQLQQRLSPVGHVFRRVCSRGDHSLGPRPHEKPRIPTQLNERRQAHGLALKLRRLDAQLKTQRVFTGLRHGRHRAHDAEVSPLEHRVQGLRLKIRRTPACCAKACGQPCQQQGGHAQPHHRAGPARISQEIQEAQEQ